MAVTLKDVAELAGVSVKTVSNVVNGYDFVGEENRRRVEAALASTGYRPNVGARNLRRGRTGFLALVVPELGIPYFGELSSLVLTAARLRGWNIIIEQTQGERAQERASLDQLGPHVVDGAIVSLEALETDDFSSLAPHVPLVLLGEHALDVPLDRVAVDNVAGARAATEHLISLGRKRIGVIGDNPLRGTATLRMRGFHAALEGAGLTPDPRLVATVERYHREDGADAMRALLDSPHPPDAVFCFNDLLAIGALHALAARGLDAPGDVAVIGFDGSEESAWSHPALSTITPDKAAIASHAVALIAERSGAATGAAPATSRDLQVSFRLEARASTLGRG